MKKIITAAVLCAFSYANGVWAAGLAPEDFNRMYRLAQKGDVYALRASVQRGLNIDTVNAKGNTGLCIAIYRHDQRAYNTFRAAGANPRHPCTQMIPSATYDEFMSSSSVIGINETPRAAYNVIHSGFLWSPKFWIVAGLGAAGIAAKALSGGGGGGSKSKPNTPTNYVNLATKAGTYLYTVSESVPGEEGSETTVLSKKNLIYLQQSRDAGNLVNITGLEYVTWADELMTATVATYNVLNNPLTLADELKVSNEIIGGLQGILVANGDVVGGQVGMATYGWHQDGTRSGIENQASINISGPNAAIGIVASDNATIVNRADITLTSEESNKTDAYMDTIIGLYGDTGASLTNKGIIDGTGAPSGNNTVIGMMIAEIGNATGLPSGYSSITAEAINDGSMTMTSANNAANMIAMGSYVPSAYYGILSSLPQHILINTGTIYIQYTGDTIGGALRYGLGLRGGIGMRADYRTVATNKTDISVNGGDGQVTAMLAVNGGTIESATGANINVGDFKEQESSSSSSSEEDKPIKVDTTSLGSIYGLSALQGNLTYDKNTVINDGNINLYADNASAVFLGTKDVNVTLKENSTVNIFGNNQAVVESASSDAVERVTLGGKIENADPTKYDVNGDYSGTYIVKGKINHVDSYANITIRKKTQEQESTSGGDPVTVDVPIYLDIFDDEFMDNGGIFHNYGTITWEDTPGELYYKGSDRDYYFNAANFVNEAGATLNIKNLADFSNDSYDGIYGHNISNYTLNGTITADSGEGRLVYIYNDSDKKAGSKITNNATLSSNSLSETMLLRNIETFENNGSIVYNGGSKTFLSTHNVSVINNNNSGYINGYYGIIAYDGDLITINNAGVIYTQGYSLRLSATSNIINNSNIIYSDFSYNVNTNSSSSSTKISNTGIIEGNNNGSLAFSSTNSANICNGGTFDANGNCKKADMTADNAAYKEITGHDIPKPAGSSSAVPTIYASNGSGVYIATKEGTLTNYGYIYGTKGIRLYSLGNAYNINNYGTIYGGGTSGYAISLEASPNANITINNGISGGDNTNTLIRGDNTGIYILENSGSKTINNLTINNYAEMRSPSSINAQSDSVVVGSFSLNNAGTITGTSSFGASLATVDGNYSVTNSGTISSNNAALNASKVKGSYTLTNSGTITATNDNAVYGGVYQGDTVKVSNTGTITGGTGYTSVGTTNYFYAGLSLTSPQSVATICNGGTINSNGSCVKSSEVDSKGYSTASISGGHGIYVENLAGTLTLNNYGYITAEEGTRPGTYRYSGIYINGTGESPLFIYNNGSITGKSYFGSEPSAAISLSNSAAQGYTIKNNAGAALYGDNSYGIYVSGKSTTTNKGYITNDGEITSTYHGIYLYSVNGTDETTITNNGKILSNSGNGIAVSQSKPYIKITNNGTLSSSQNAISISGASNSSTDRKVTINNSGKIYSTIGNGIYFGFAKTSSSDTPSTLDINISNNGTTSEHASIGAESATVYSGISVSGATDAAFKSVSIVNDTYGDIYASGSGIYFRGYTNPVGTDENIQILNRGYIKVTSSGGTGIYSNANVASYKNGSELSNYHGVINTGTIDVAANSAYGVKIEAIKAAGSSTSAFQNQGTINVGSSSALVSNSYGVYLAPYGYSTISSFGMTNSSGANINVYASPASGTPNVGIHIVDQTDNSTSMAATNYGTITLYGSNTRGMYNSGYLTNEKNITITNSSSTDNARAMALNYGTAMNNTAGIINVDGDHAYTGLSGFSFDHANYGMWANGTNNAVIRNYGTINVNGKYNVGMATSNGNAAAGSPTILQNTGTINISGTSNYGVLVSGGIAEVGGTINLKSASNYGVHVESDANADISADINATANYSRGIYSKTSYANVTYNGNLTVNGIGSYGIYADTGSTATNKGTINVFGTSNCGMYATGQGQNGKFSSIINYSSGIINVVADASFGMLANGSGVYATNRGTINVYGQGSYGMEAINGATAENYGTIIVHSNNTTGKYAMRALTGSTIKNEGYIYVYGSNSYAMDASSSSSAYNDRKRAGIYENGYIYVAGTGNLAMSTDSSSSGNLVYDSSSSDNGYISAVSGYSSDNLFSGNISNKDVYPIYINSGTYPVPSEPGVTPPSPPATLAAAPKMMMAAAPKSMALTSASPVVDEGNGDESEDNNTDAQDDIIEAPVLASLSLSSAPSAISQAIVLEEGSSFINNGTLVTDEDLNVDDWKQDDSATVEITENSVYSAKSLKGTFTANASIVQSPTNAKSYTATNALVGDDNGINVNSNSYLFTASLLSSPSAPSLTSVLMTMKDFNEVMDDKTLGAWLNTNYDNNNRVAMFNRLKGAKTQDEYETVVNEELGLNFVPTIAKQNMDFIRDTGTMLNDTLFEDMKDAKRETFFVGVDAYYHRNSSYDSLIGYDSDGENIHGLYNEDFGDNVGVGFGFGIANLHSKYDDDSSSNQNIAQMYIPVSFSNDDLAFVSMPKFGAGYGEYKRDVDGDGSHKADLVSYYYGISNQLRKAFDVDGITIEPVAEFNVNAMYMDKIKEEDNLFIKSQNSVSVEAGLGLYIGKKIEFANSSALKLRLGGTYYRELENPYQRISAGFTDADGHYNMHGYKNGKNRAVIALKADYGLEQFNVYLKAAEYLERSSNFSLQAGMKYNFK